MSLLSAIFGSRPKSASVAKDRLQLIIARERSERGGVDWLPRLQQDILDVIARYVQVDPGAVKVQMERGENLDLVEISITLPERARTPAR